MSSFSCVLTIIYNFQILILSLTISVCSSEAPREPQLHQQSGKQAISSQMFHRDDVPLSYKYTSVHDYTTATPETNLNAYHHIHQSPINSRNQGHVSHSQPIHNQLQYAPIQLHANNIKGELSKEEPNQPLYTKISFTTPSPVPNVQVKPNLPEPNYNSYQEKYMYGYKQNVRPHNSFQSINSELNPAFDVSYIKAYPKFEPPRQAEVR